jgi:hypothetical protein
MQALEGRCRRTHDDLDAAREARMRQVRTGHFRVARLELERHEPSVRGQGAREADRAVAAERADFQHAPRAQHASEKREHRTLRGRHADRGKARGVARPQGVSEDFVGEVQALLEITIDFVPPVCRFHGAIL